MANDRKKGKKQKTSKRRKERNTQRVSTGYSCSNVTVTHSLFFHSYQCLGVGPVGQQLQHWRGWVIAKVSLNNLIGRITQPFSSFNYSNIYHRCNQALIKSFLRCDWGQLCPCIVGPFGSCCITCLLAGLRGSSGGSLGGGSGWGSGWGPGVGLGGGPGGRWGLPDRGPGATKTVAPLSGLQRLIRRPLGLLALSTSCIHAPCSGQLLAFLYWHWDP